MVGLKAAEDCRLYQNTAELLQNVHRRII